MDRITDHEADVSCIDDRAISSYQKYGFLAVRNVLSAEQVQRYADAVLAAVSRMNDHHRADSRLDQFVNVWREDEVVRELTLNPTIGGIAQTLAGKSLRLWHDHALLKPPHNQLATEFHQDQPYWPHDNSTQPISCWIALCDVPVRKGCMSFIPGSHTYTTLRSQRLDDAGSLFSLCPLLQWYPQVTLPLRAGDCTFHHGRTAHMANANMTDDIRIAHVVIYMDADTTFTGGNHVVTDGMAAEGTRIPAGAVLDYEQFPLVQDCAHAGNSR